MNTQIIKVFLLILTLLLSIGSPAQVKTDPGKFKLKLYMNGIYEHSSDNTYSGSLDPGQTYVKDSKDFDLGTFSIALEINKSMKSSHQFELMPIRFQRQDVEEKITDGDNIQIVGDGLRTSFQTTLGYQYIYYFRSDKIIRPPPGTSTWDSYWQ